MQCAQPGPAQILWQVVNNTNLAKVLSEVSIPIVDYMFLPVNGNKLSAMRMTPSTGLARGKVPTLMYAYNGPLAQTVIAQHPLLFQDLIGRWLMYLVENFGFQVRKQSFLLLFCLYQHVCVCV